MAQEDVVIKNTLLVKVIEVFISSTQRHYRRLILLLNTTHTATYFGRTTIFRQKYIIS
jgi:hypothetical protein